MSATSKAERTRRLVRRRHLQVQSVERARRRADGLVGNPRIVGRARQMGVTEQNLNEADIRAILQKMRGEGTPQRMHGDAFGNGCGNC